MRILYFLISFFFHYVHFLFLVVYLFLFLIFSLFFLFFSPVGLVVFDLGEERPTPVRLRGQKPTFLVESFGWPFHD